MDAFIFLPLLAMLAIALGVFLIVVFALASLTQVALTRLVTRVSPTGKGL